MRGVTNEACEAARAQRAGGRSGTPAKGTDVSSPWAGSATVAAFSSGQPPRPTRGEVVGAAARSSLRTGAAWVVCVSRAASPAQKNVAGDDGRGEGPLSYVLV